MSAPTLTGSERAESTSAADCITDVLVVVPARNEAAALPACLSALAAASAHVLDTPDPPRVHRTVVLDRCTDGTADVVGAWPAVVGLRSMAGTAGGARALGVAAGLDALAASGVPPDRVWVACTDADSEVPPAWLTHHLTVARGGADLLLGTVSLRPEPSDGPGLDDVTAPLAAAWAQRYEPVEGHGHVHATNLGVRGSTYLAAGGFAAMAAHEDVELASAATAVGGRVVKSARQPVTTSGRLVGRAPGGFADHLVNLARTLR